MGYARQPGVFGLEWARISIRAFTAQPAKTGVNALTFFAGYVK
jgi:hypothetical protein